MRLTADLIANSNSYINALYERELDLRGHKISHIENLGVQRDQDCIDFTDNDITVLANFPLSPRLHTLLLARNRVASIQPNLADSVPNLTTLGLAQNRVAELADLEPLGRLKRLTCLVLAENPVAAKENYRYWILWLCPSVRFLDFTKIKDAERSRAKELFGTKDTPTSLASKILQSRSVSAFSLPSTNGTSSGGLASEKQNRVKLTDSEKERVAKLIKNASSLQEIARLEKELNEGRIPGGAADNDQMET